MWHKKSSLTFIAIILLYIGVRLLMLFTDLEGLSSTSREELYVGLVAKELMEGARLPFFDYQYAHYVGGSLMMTLLTIPFFALFGPYLFSLKLAALVFYLTTMVLW